MNRVDNYTLDTIKARSGNVRKFYGAFVRADIKARFPRLHACGIIE